MCKIQVKHTGQICGGNTSWMWRMLFACAKAAHARLSFDNIVWAGAAEMNRHTGHNCLTVFTDLKANNTSGKASYTL
jgi:hypothetical protein